MNDREVLELLEDVTVYLGQVVDRYPGGIPEDQIVVPESAASAESKEPFFSGSGDVDADLVFLGAEGVDAEVAPGSFSGKSWALLSAAIENGMKRPVSSVYCLNCLLSPSEVLPVEVARQNLERVQPRFLVLLGEEAFTHLRGELFPCEEPFEQLRGRWISSPYGMCMVTHSLAAVLFAAEMKKEFWQDLQEIMRRMEGEP